MNLVRRRALPGGGGSRTSALLDIRPKKFHQHLSWLSQSNEYGTLNSMCSVTPFQ